MIVSGVDLLPHPPGVLHDHDVLHARADRGHLGVIPHQLKLVVADVDTLGNCFIFNSDWSELFLRDQMEADELRRRGTSRWRSCRRSGRAATMRPPWLGQPPCHPDYSHQSQPCSLSQILLLTEASIHWTLLIVTSITSSKYASETLFSSLSPTSWLSVGDSIVSSPLDLLSLSPPQNRTLEPSPACSQWWWPCCWWAAPTTRWRYIQTWPRLEALEEPVTPLLVTFSS